MDLRSQRETVYWRAPELARSGKLRNWQSVEIQLRKEGIYGVVPQFENNGR